MIILYHDGKNLVETSFGSVDEARSIIDILLATAQKHPEELLIWCDIRLKTHLNPENIPTIFHHKKIMASFAPDEYLPEDIGYVEEGPFIPVCKSVTYPTWRMHARVGGIHAQVLLALQSYLNTRVTFDYFLHRLAKIAMPLGLFCYSEPRLLKSVPEISDFPKAGTSDLFRFVAQHYKKRWCFLLLLNLFLYEKRLPLFSFFRALRHSKKRLPTDLFINLTPSAQRLENLGSIDVIIPTLCRKKYLYDVLKDLSVQTHLPKKVIIVEQNPDSEQVSELDYLQAEKWPFRIVHHFTHQMGACRARNLALQEVTADWVFLADDDIRFREHFLETAFASLEEFKLQSATFGCFQKGQQPTETFAKQWSAFGSGCSLVKSILLKKITFNTAFEHGYGEDADFGMQLRKMGVDVIYFPEPFMLHLKAPTGGFRKLSKMAWQDEKTQPKPSPTVMLFKQLHLTRQQVLGYKTLLAVKFYRQQEITNPVSYLNYFRKAWKVSEQWAQKILVYNSSTSN